MPSPGSYIIFSTQRVGSHLLGDVIGSHPDFSQVGEALIPDTPKAGSFDAFLDHGDHQTSPASLWRDYLSHLQTRKPGATYVGLLVKYEHVERINGESFISDPIFNDVRIIHLVRRNTLRTIASHYLAVARGLHVADEHDVIDRDIRGVDIPPSEIMHALRKKTTIVQGFRDKLADRPLVLEVAYEDIMDGALVHETLLRRLCEFFDVDDNFTRRPNTVKLAPQELRTLLINYDDVAAALQGTEFQEMLD